MTADGSDRSFGVPRFDVVLRGYDRRQVDEHLSRVSRVLARLRADLEAASARPGPPMGSPAGRPRPSPRRRPDGESEDVVGTFTDRMRTILQAAEDEAAEIRARAQADARASEERAGSAQASARARDAVRAELNDLVRQRDTVLADLTRVRGQLEALLSGPTGRIPVRGGPAVEPGTEPAPGPAAPPPRGPDVASAERTALLSPPEPAERTALLPAADPAPGPDAPPVAAPDATVKVPARTGEEPGPPDADHRAPSPPVSTRPAPVSRTG